MRYGNFKFFLLFTVVLIVIVLYLIFNCYNDRNFTKLYRNILTSESDDNIAWDLIYGVLSSEDKDYFFFLFYSGEKISIKLINIDSNSDEVVNYSDSIELDQYLDFFRNEQELDLKFSLLKIKIIRKENSYFYNGYEREVEFFEGFDSISDTEVFIETSDQTVHLNGKAVRQVIQVSKDLDYSEYKDWFVFSSDEYDFLIFEYEGIKYGYIYDKFLCKFNMIDNFELEKLESVNSVDYKAKVNFSNGFISLAAPVKQNIPTVSDQVIVSILDVKKATMVSEKNNLINLNNCMGLIENYETN